MFRKNASNYIDLEEQMKLLVDRWNNARAVSNMEEINSTYQELHDTLHVVKSVRDSNISCKANFLESSISQAMEHGEMVHLEYFEKHLQELMEQLHIASENERKQRNRYLYKAILDLSRIAPLLTKEDENKKRKKLRLECRNIAWKLGWVKINDNDDPTVKEHLDFIASRIRNCQDDRVAEEVQQWLHQLLYDYDCIGNVVKFVNGVNSR